MASYTVLQQGDNLPSVAVLQKLLNRTGAQIRVDCSYGPRTAAAVNAFQRARGLTESDGVGEETWRRLTAGEDLPIADCVDVFDERLYQQQAQTVAQAGGDPLFLGGMSNGLAQVAADLGALKGLFLLRFVGHGCPGVQGLGIGKGGWIEHRDGKEIRHIFAGEHSRLQLGTARAEGWGALAGIFGPYASVELHGCHVAGGGAGRKFLADLASVLRTPVSAGVNSQRNALRFDGPTFTAWPGTNPRAWCDALPDFAGRSVP